MGLFLQTAAYAAGPQTAVTTVQSKEMDASCMEMMKQQPDKKPCHGLTLKCIATMGCITTVGLPGVGAPVLVRQFAEPQIFWATFKVLIGSVSVPEQHPPSLLG